MKARNTIILLLIAAGLYAYMRFYESKQPTTEEAEQMSGNVVQIDQDKIDGINITNNETRIELRKHDSQWQMEAPVKDRADAAAVAQLLSAVDSLHKDTSLQPESGKDEVRDFGLVKPNVTLQLLGQSAPQEILFGKDTAIDGKEYIRLANSNEVYVVSNELKNQVTKKTDDFRDHQLSDINASQVITAEIDTPAGQIELKKDHDHWQIVRPISARGDDAKIADLIAQTLNTSVDSFVPSEQAAAANTAINDARDSVSFTTETTAKPVELQVSKPFDKAKNQVYAKLSTRDGLFVLPRKVADIFNTQPNTVRDRHLIRLNFDTVDRIHIAPAGLPEILLARKGEEWTIKSLNNKPANRGDVQKMASELQNQEVTAFVSDVATDLPKYGLDQPRLKVTFSSYASENTAETKAGEEPLETILFGKTDGGIVYAKLDDEPFIVSVPKTLLDDIHTDPLQWQDLAIYNFKPDDVTGLDVTPQGQATLSLVKEKGGWKTTKGDVVLNSGNVQSVANTLATLRAVRWAGATTPAQGLAAPAETITFTTADKKSNTVKIGAPAGQYWNASASGFDGTFLVSRPDHDALTADLLPAPAPAGTPILPPASSPMPSAESSPAASPK